LFKERIERLISGLMPKKLHEYIKTAFEDRAVSDYETTPIEQETSEETI